MLLLTVWTLTKVYTFLNSHVLNLTCADSPGEQVLPKDANNNLVLLQNHYHDSLNGPHGPEESLFTYSTMDIGQVCHQELHILYAFHICEDFLLILLVIP